MRNLIRVTMTMVGVLGLVASGLVVAAPPAGADSIQQQKDQVHRKRAQVQVKINLALASEDALTAEVGRLDRAVTQETSLLAAAKREATAAAARADASQRRLTTIDGNMSVAKKALADRAVALYEHPFQSAEVVLNGVASINEYAQRQEFMTAIEGRTSDVLDAYRQQRLDEASASKQLFAARQEADRFQGVVQAQDDNYRVALASAQSAHAEEQRRVDALQTEIKGLAAQEDALQAKLAANQGATSAIFDASFAGSRVGGLGWPVHGPVTQEFGYHWGGFHPGIDIAPPYGTPVHAAGNGVVIYASWEDGYGNYTCINHGAGLSTCYGHQSAINVSVGQVVHRGDVIGAEGSTGYSTGPHVHFETRVNGSVENPRNFVPGNP